MVILELYMSSQKDDFVLKIGVLWNMWPDWGGNTSCLLYG